MAHPTNRFERFQLGVRKGQRRADARWIHSRPETLISAAEHIASEARTLRHTTKVCACSCCCNRREFYGPTLQERKFAEAYRRETLLVEPKVSIESPKYVPVSDEEFEFSPSDI